MKRDIVNPMPPNAPAPHNWRQEYASGFGGRDSDPAAPIAFDILAHTRSRRRKVVGCDTWSIGGSSRSGLGFIAVPGSRHSACGAFSGCLNFQSNAARRVRRRELALPWPTDAVRRPALVETQLALPSTFAILRERATETRRQPDSQGRPSQLARVPIA